MKRPIRKLKRKKSFKWEKGILDLVGRFKFISKGNAELLLCGKRNIAFQQSLNNLINKRRVKTVYIWDGERRHLYLTKAKRHNSKYHNSHSLGVERVAIFKYKQGYDIECEKVIKRNKIRIDVYCKKGDEEIYYELENKYDNSQKINGKLAEYKSHDLLHKMRLVAGTEFVKKQLERNASEYFLNDLEHEINVLSEYPLTNISVQ